MSGPVIRPVGTVVTLRYKAGRTWLHPHHDRQAVVVATPYGPCKRNHLVRLVGGEDAGRWMVVPAGHLRLAADRSK